MGLAYNTYLSSNKIYGCKSCKAHLANHEDIISRVSRCANFPFFPCKTFLSVPLYSATTLPYCPIYTIYSCYHGEYPGERNRLVLADTSATDNRGGRREQQNFRGQHGKAYLFNNVVNIEAGEPSERSMTTGRHIVRDIACKQCKETVGWKYDKAYESSEKYKEGKFILEAELLCNVS